MVEFDIPSQSYKTIELEDFFANLLDTNKIYWIHCDLNDKKDVERFIAKVALPAEVLELCDARDSIPQLSEHTDSLTLKFQSLREGEFTEVKKQRFDNLVIHLTSQYCFTASRKPLQALRDLQGSYQESLQYAKTPGFILYLIFDNLINDYAKLLYKFEAVLDAVDMTRRENHETIYVALVNFKRRLMDLRRSAAGVREILLRISGRKMAVISDECHQALGNLLNQSQMIFQEIDSIRDIINELLSQIDYSLVHKMNETMRVLTAFAAIFLPLTLITGIYGMNFRHIPELEWEYGYYIAIVLIVTVGFALYYVFKKLKWF